MANDGLIKNLVSFFKTARHLWGRCPDCDAYFRLSDVAISSSPNPPKDWLRRVEIEKRALQRREESLENAELELDDRESELDEMQNSINEAQIELDEREEELRSLDDRIEQTARRRAQDMLRSEATIRSLVKTERKSAVQQSRATLLGRILERIAPCFRTFDYDFRDMRCIADPFDYVLFDGLTIHRRVSRIGFIEVKCGKSVPSPAQRSIQDAVANHRVFTEVWNVGDPRIPITRQLPPK